MENLETHQLSGHPIQATDEQSEHDPVEANDQETQDDNRNQGSLIHHEGVSSENTWVGALLYEINGCWIPAQLVPSIVNSQVHFQAKDSDIILATMPKSGTTWLKALTFTIVNRHRYPTIAQSPLLTSNPHALVPFLEYDIYSNSKSPPINVEEIPSPRIFSTHMHFSILPSSVLDSKCRIIYICRNPLDAFVSHWLFALENFCDGLTEPPVIDEALEKFSQGIHYFGPFWNHMLDYWEASLQKDSHNVLFLKYEDLKADPIFELKKIAEFLDLPFSADEEKNGLVDEVVKLCSFKNLKNLEVNKSGKDSNSIKHSSYFRKGEIGDWVNYVPASMAETVKKVVEEKLRGSALAFEPTL